MFSPNCTECLKPAARRLALFHGKDDYVCYSESYIKCFWGLCDLPKSPVEIVIPDNTDVITNQPCRQENCLYKNVTPKLYLDSVGTPN